ncbi:hypothetical protein [Thermoflavimicrobium dichotomicum]|uniref:Lipoprotein n=1 Tax=Thermoflavimicrobium dichotomicum TaxID=46223 RepID=A0A1I3LGZ6_9BACL|nr:hypothetical protein [Thermoflavimicrobium dichotomicum]SFI84009.1 hypothetical protein SAMN05421852_102190 [Thermoflavimicrobium dichotomicum]
MLKKLCLLLFICLMSIGIVACSEESVPKAEHVITKKEDHILYQNTKHHFTAKLPSEWDGLFIVKSDPVSKDQSIPELKETISFEFDNGKASIFKISIFQIPSKEEWDKKGFGEIWNYIASKNGQTIAYQPSNEPPADYFDKSGNVKAEVKDKFQKLTKMVNDDLPKVVKSIQFE